MIDPITGFLLLALVIAVFVLWLYVESEKKKDREQERKEAKRKADEAYYTSLGFKYAATITDEDRKYFNNLRDWK